MSRSFGSSVDAFIHIEQILKRTAPPSSSEKTHPNIINNDASKTSIQMKFGTLKPRVQATKPTPRPRVNTDIIVDPKLSLEQICEGGNSARTTEPLSKENHNHMLVDKILQSLNNSLKPRHTRTSRTRNLPRLSHGPSHFRR